MKPKCEGCNKLAEFRVVITQYNNYGTEPIVIPLCDDHMEDPGPLLSFRRSSVRFEAPQR